MRNGETMKTKIFAYKGNVGIEIPETGIFINNPKSPGQLGCVISTSEIEITKEAKNVIRKARREGGSFAELMLTKHDKSIESSYGESSIGVMGFGNINLGNDFCISRDCNLSVLDDCTETEMDVPNDYKDFINNNMIV